MHRHILNAWPVKDFSYQGSFITIVDKAYPKALLALNDAPYVLFYEGNINFLNEPMVSVVGSRRPSAYSKRITRDLVTRLAHTFVIVSGMATGIDGVAHCGAITGKTIAVVATGLDCCYPLNHRELFSTLKKHHLVISEYPYGVGAQKHHFPIRNRIIAALGTSLFVMSAKLRSGTMHSVNEALALNKEIYVLPHPIDDETGLGCNTLILEGASILTNLADFDTL